MQTVRRLLSWVLVKWSHFDPYYFDNLKKLDRSDAQKQIEHLRQLKEIRDAAIKQEHGGMGFRSQSASMNSSIEGLRWSHPS